MNWTLIIAVAALVFSLASPIASEWIRGHYRLKEKQQEAEMERQKQNLDFYRRHRAEVIENYLRAAGRALNFDTLDNAAALGAASGEIYIYLDKSLWHHVDLFRSYLSDGRLEEAKMEFSALCKKLSEEEVRSEYQPEPGRRNKHKPDRV